MMNQANPLLGSIQRVRSEKTIPAYGALANVIKGLSKTETGLPEFRIGVLRNYTVEPLLPILMGEAVLAGFHPSVHISEFDAIFQTVSDSGSEFYSFQPDFIILTQWLETLSSRLVLRFISLTAEQVQEDIDFILNTLNIVLGAIRRNTQAPVLVNNFPLIPYRTLGILDSQRSNLQTQTLIRLNQRLLDVVSNFQDVFIVDYTTLFAQVGFQSAFDERYWHIGRAPLSQKVLIPLAQEYMKYFKALRGKTKKCLVLDCDNTLWGGVIGEDGMSGIKLGAGYPGSCFQSFQQEILNLHDRGVILALCSKNNEQDVFEVLRKHPEMLIKEEHLSTWQINWQDKATNLKRIAAELNIGLDSLVFVDDSHFECDFVRQQLPQVTVIQLPVNPFQYRSLLTDLGHFDSLSYSSEDRKRNQLYRQEKERKQLQAEVGSMEEFLRQLKLVAEIGVPREVDIPRIAQLTQKTNQFNLTTRRYTEGDIRAFISGDHSDVFCLKLKDRVSDMGLVAVAIVKYQENVGVIDSFLMSCRVIGRGVEEAVLAHVFKAVQKRIGCDKILGNFIATDKNVLVVDFYKKHGFTLVKEHPQGSEWEYPVTQVERAYPNWIQVELLN